MPGPVEPLEAWVRESIDLSDVVGDDDPDDLHAIEWAQTNNGELALWAWRLGERQGIALMDMDNAWRLPGSAAQIVLDALHGRGPFSRLLSDARLDHYPLRYRPF